MCILVIWVEPIFTVMPLVLSTAWPGIDLIGYWYAAVMSLVCVSDWDRLSFDNYNSLRNTCEITPTTYILTHCFFFIGIHGPPTFLLGRLIVVGCVALHMRAKHNSYYFCKAFLYVLNSFLGNESVHARAHVVGCIGVWTERSLPSVCFQNSYCRK